MGTLIDCGCLACRYAEHGVSTGEGMEASFEPAVCEDCRRIVAVQVPHRSALTDRDSDTTSQFGTCPHCQGLRIEPPRVDADGRWACPRCGAWMERLVTGIWD